MALFGSTSPSFPVLASLDLARGWWEREGPEAYRRWRRKRRRCAGRRPAPMLVAPRLARLAGGAQGSGAAGAGRRPGGLTGEALAAYFRAAGCEPEHAGGRQVIFILTPFNTPRNWSACMRRLRGSGIGRLGLRTAQAGRSRRFRRGKGRWRFCRCVRLCCRRRRACPPKKRQAGSRRRRSARPPGIAAAVPGERLSEALAQSLAAAGISRIVVLKTL